MAFYFKDTKKDITMTEEDKEGFGNINTCRFCEKDIESDEIRDHCHLTGNYRGLAHNTCNIYVTQQQTNIIPFVFHNFSNYDCRMFFEKLVDLENDKVKFKIILKQTKNRFCQIWLY